MTRLPSEYWRLYQQNQDHWRHVYGGEYDLNPDTRVFNNVVVGIPPASWVEDSLIRYGMDYGTTDSTTVVKVRVIERPKKVIFIEREAYERNVPLHKNGDLIREVVDDPTEDNIKADRAAAHAIQYLQREGFLVEPAIKGPGSVENGIRFLNGYQIWIHPDCIWAQHEARAYKHRVNRLTGAKLKEPIDADNHIWDAIRYATEDLQMGNPVEEDVAFMEWA